jgi:hypothetical protein
MIGGRGYADFRSKSAGKRASATIVRAADDPIVSRSWRLSARLVAVGHAFIPPGAANEPDAMLG